jgi:hypothetical protein
VSVDEINLKEPFCRLQCRARVADDEKFRGAGFVSRDRRNY